MSKPVYKVAVLDMYQHAPNQGMRCLKDIIETKSQQNGAVLNYKVFDVRSGNEVPGTDYDIYISTGGPGSPMQTNDEWEKKYFNLIDKLVVHNEKEKDPQKKKHVFFICHSFQMICRHWQLAEVNKRKSPAFGIFPIHKTEEGKEDNIFDEIPDPFYAVDSRDWQVVQPDLKKIEEFGAIVLSIEKERPHVPFERAVMAIRFSNEMFGTQFHPEADVQGVRVYLNRPDKKNHIISTYGVEKYNSMIAQLEDTDKIRLTHNAVIPSFLEESIHKLSGR